MQIVLQPFRPSAFADENCTQVCTAVRYGRATQMLDKASSVCSCAEFVGTVSSVSHERVLKRLQPQPGKR